MSGLITIILSVFIGNVLFLNTSNYQPNLVSNDVTDELSTKDGSCFELKLYTHDADGIITVTSVTDINEDVIENITLDRNTRYEVL